MILVQTGQFPLGRIQMWENLALILMQERRITTKLIAECLGVSREEARKVMEKK